MATFRELKHYYTEPRLNFSTLHEGIELNVMGKNYGKHILDQYAREYNKKHSPKVE
jgi:hypothetical protein